MAVQTPNSISAKAAPEKAFIITLTKEGKTFLSLGEETKKMDILKDINTSRSLGLTEGELQKWNRQEFVGVPFSQVKGYLNMATPPPPDRLPGIPIDTAQNELIDWMKSITNVYAGQDQSELQQLILVKGDSEALYPMFKAVKQALKKNQLFKFRIITNGEAVPIGSELYMNSQGEGQVKE